MSEVVHFYQTGTFTVGNRLVTPEERAGQASMEPSSTRMHSQSAGPACSTTLLTQAER